MAFKASQARNTWLVITEIFISSRLPLIGHDIAWLHLHVGLTNEEAHSTVFTQKCLSFSCLDHVQEWSFCSIQDYAVWDSKEALKSYSQKLVIFLYTHVLWFIYIYLTHTLPNICLNFPMTIPILPSKHIS